MSAVFPVRHVASVLGLLAAGISAIPTAAVAQFESAPSLKLEPARRFYARFGYTYISPNDKSEETRDLGGPVVRANETRRVGGGFTGTGELELYKSDAARCILGIQTAGACPTAASINNNREIRFGTGVLSTADRTLQQLLQGIADDAATSGVDAAGLGVPSGVLNDAKGSGSPTVSVGMFLDEEKKWAAETFVLALPFKNSVYGKGRIGSIVEGLPGSDGGPTDLGKVVETNILPATVLLHRFFGDKDAKVRFSVGVGLSYAIFFDSQATESLERWAGGPTKVKIKNAFGGGLFVGGQYALNDRWHISALVGYEKLQTRALLTTDTRPDMLADSLVSAQSGADIGPSTLSAVQLGSALGINSTNPGSFTTNGYIYNGVTQDGVNVLPVTATKAMLRNLARARQAEYGTAEGSLGEYTREIKTKLDPWVFNISVGYSF